MNEDKIKLYTPSKDEIVKAILKVTGGGENKEFTKTAITHELGRTKSTSSIDKIIKELESEGFIKFKEKETLEFITF